MTASRRKLMHLLFAEYTLHSQIQKKYLNYILHISPIYAQFCLIAGRTRRIFTS